MAQRYLGDTELSLASLYKTAVSTRNMAPIVDPAAFAIGPNIPAGGMNKTLASVSIPSVDGPKDNKQMAAFVRPWQATTSGSGTHALSADEDGGNGTDAGSEGGASAAKDTLPHIEDMFGDRWVVPCGCWGVARRLRVARSMRIHISPFCSCARVLWFSFPSSLTTTITTTTTRTHRPVSVPVGSVRNRRASGHAPVSPMVQSGHNWNDRAMTAPAKGHNTTSTSLPQLAPASR